MRKFEPTPLRSCCNDEAEDEGLFPIAEEGRITGHGIDMSGGIDELAVTNSAALNSGRRPSFGKTKLTSRGKNLLSYITGNGKNDENGRPKTATGNFFAHNTEIGGKIVDNGRSIVKKKKSISFDETAERAAIDQETRDSNLDKNGNPIRKTDRSNTPFSKLPNNNSEYTFTVYDKNKNTEKTFVATPNRKRPGGWTAAATGFCVKKMSPKKEQPVSEDETEQSETTSPALKSCLKKEEKQKHESESPNTKAKKSSGFRSFFRKNEPEWVDLGRVSHVWIDFDYVFGLKNIFAPKPYIYNYSELLLSGRTKE